VRTLQATWRRIAYHAMSEGDVVTRRPQPKFGYRPVIWEGDAYRQANVQPGDRVKINSSVDVGIVLAGDDEWVYRTFPCYINGRGMTDGYVYVLRDGDSCCDGYPPERVTKLPNPPKLP
jgi:hypothetical protein